MKDEELKKVAYLFVKIGNKKLMDVVQSQENFQLLEHIIDEIYTKDYQSLFNKKYEYGDKAGKKDLKRLLEQSKKDVDELLDLNIEKKPNITKNSLFPIDGTTVGILSQYIMGIGMYSLSVSSLINMGPISWLWLVPGSFVALGTSFIRSAISNHKYLMEYSAFDGRTNKIRIALCNSEDFDREILLKPEIDHEYSHFILKNTLFDGISPKFTDELEIFDEGFAQGIEENLARQSYEKDDNPAWLFLSLNQHLKFLKQVYLDTCRKKSFRPSTGLLDSIKFSDDVTFENLSKRKKDLSHAYGEALFKILEHYHGKDIYKRTVRKDLNFL